VISKIVGSLFRGNSDDDPQPQQTHEQEVAADDQKTAAALDDLRSAVRRAGAILPPLVTSRLRQIDDLLRVVIDTIAIQDASTEQRFLLNAMIRDYLPTPLHAFLALSETDRAADSRSTALFIEQLGILEETIHDLLNQIRIGAIEELSTHGRFLAEKFAEPTLRLDGS
jgi:signal transduction histidine kinase